MENILVCDDDREIVEAIEIYLRQDGYQIYKAYDGEQAIEILKKEKIHLLIIDIMMPRLDGIRATLKIREASSIPIIMLSAKSEDTDKILGLNMGADDYITKPFSLMVLRARVNAIQRRKTAAEDGKQGSMQQNCFRQNGFSFDFEQMVFTAEGETVELSKTEQKLLRLLVSNCGNTLSRDMLIDRIWSDGAEFVEENALSVTMNRLRAKLPGAPIKTVYGIGYVWGKG